MPYATKIYDEALQRSSGNKVIVQCESNIVFVKGSQFLRNSRRCVDFTSKTCLCYGWQGIGIPFVHTIYAARHTCRLKNKDWFGSIFRDVY